MILRFFALLCLLSGGIKAFAQKNEHKRIDSLINELSRQKEDTNKVNILCCLAQSYQYSNPDEGVKYGSSGLALAKKLAWKRGEALANNYIGENYDCKGSYTEAIDYYTTALKAFEEMGNKKFAGSVNMNIGIAYYRLDEFKKALEYYARAQKIFEETDEKASLGSVLGNIGNVYLDQGNYPEALAYYGKGLKVHEETGNKRGESNVAANIGAVYFSESNYPAALEYYMRALRIHEELGDKIHEASVMGNIGNLYTERGEYAKGLDYYFKALKIAEEVNNKFEIASFTEGIGHVYQNQGDFVKALDYFSQSLKVCEDIGDKIGTASVKGNICVVYKKQKKYGDAIGCELDVLKMHREIGDKRFEAHTLSQIGENYLYLAEGESGPIIKDASIPSGKSARLHLAISYLRMGIDTANKYSTPKVLQDCYKNISNAYMLSGDYRMALENYKKYTDIKDSIFTKENDKKLMQITLQYDYDKKEAVAKVNQEKKDALSKADLNKQKNMKYASLAGAFLLLIIAITSISAYKQKNRDNLIISREKQRSEDLLLNILPAEVAEELKDTGSAKARSYDLATVLFTDFKGFTQMSEKMSPEELVSELDTCFKKFDEIAQKHGIEKIKTIGDSYMAVGGLPDPRSGSPADVVKAALEMKDFILQRKSERALEEKPSFEMRVGIHTGPVVAGIVGVKKFQYDIWGDTVNTASRMESSGEVGRVNISGSTYDLVKGDFKCEYRGKVSAKGKGEIDMYFVT